MQCHLLGIRSWAWNPGSGTTSVLLFSVTSSAVPKLSSLTVPYRGWTRAVEKRDSSFRPPGFSPYIWGGEERRGQELDYATRWSRNGKYIAISQYPDAWGIRWNVVAMSLPKLPAVLAVIQGGFNRLLHQDLPNSIVISLGIQNRVAGFFSFRGLNQVKIRVHKNGFDS